MRRIRKVVLTLVLVSVLFIGNAPLHVRAATTPPTVDDAYVLSRLSQLAGLLGINEGNLNEGDGVYFTVNQQKCGTGLGGHSCDNCKNTNVANAEWFKNIFGTVDAGGFPKQYGDDGVVGGHIGWSCWGFANFAMWYATSAQNTDNIVGTLVATSTFTKENILSLLKPGDIIRSNGHSMIFISADENTMKVMDSNWRPAGDATNCRVRIREFGYNDSEFNYFKGKAMGITRAGNYDPNSSGSETTPPILSNVRVQEKDNTGYTVYCEVTDNEGVAKVCFPTWTEANGQDDLALNWQETQAVYTPVSGNTYAFRVNTSDHNEEDGVYCTEIYAYDAAGNYSTEWVVVVIDKTSPTVNEQVRAFVERMYTVALGRESDTSGIEYWTEQLLSHQVDGAGISAGFILSDELEAKNYSNEAYVKVLYRTFFDREADEGGKAFWIEQMNAGRSRKSVLAGFVNSVEFTAICESYGITRGTMADDATATGAGQFVERLYSIALERPSDPAGLEDWAKRISNRTDTPEGVAKNFFLSAEYAEKNTRNDKYVETLYLVFMGRTSEAGGKEYWVEQLSRGLSRESVLEGFAQSQEFKEIMARYGL